MAAARSSDAQISDSVQSASPTLLYHQTVIPTQNISHTIEGSFTLPNADDLVVIRHNVIELWTLHSDSSTAECVHSSPLFATVYAAVAVPTSSAATSAAAASSARDGSSVLDASASVRRDGVNYLALTTEAGFVSLLRYELAEPPVPTQISLSNEDAGAATANMFISTSLKGSFIRVSDVCLGRSGARLTVPGARMAVDTRGEALFISALMSNKVVIPIRRTGATPQDLLSGSIQMASAADDDLEEKDEENAKKRHKRLHSVPKGVIALGSPIEAHRHTVIHSVCALEGLPDQTVFAALEQDVIETTTAQADKPPQQEQAEGAFLKLPGSSEKRTECRKYLVVYAYLPSLQQVQRTHLVKLSSSAHLLVPVPAAPCGPGGVLVCTDTELVWYDLSSQQGTTSASSAATGGGVFKCSVPLPRRVSFTETPYDPSIIRHAVACVARDFFLLLQDEQGDLYRVLLTTTDVQKAYNALRLAQKSSSSSVSVPTPLSVHYYDTIPPTSDMVMFRKGYLFAAVEAGPLHRLYKITQNGYTKESEYIVRRVRTQQQHHGAPVAIKSENALDKSPAGKKRERGGDGMPTPSAMAMPFPVPQAAAPQSRVIAVYKPHQAPRHMSMTQTFPNTPAILDFTTTIPGEDGIEGGARQQPQVQVNAVAGRGASSVLLNARYGYATRRESKFNLRASFQSVMPLASAWALQRLSLEQHEVMAQANELMQSRQHGRGGRGGGVSAAAKLKALRKILASAGQQATAVCTDKVILTTAQGTTVLHIGQTVEMDNWTGFVTAERTLAASTLKFGSGYMQVTPRGLYVIPSSPMDAQNSLLAPDGHADASMANHQHHSIAVETANWTEPHGKLIMAATTTPTTALVSFMQGGIASFDMGLTNTQLRQCDLLPTFPASQAVALLQPPASAQAGAALQADLKSLLFRHGGGGASAGGVEHMDLAAVATIAQEVYLFNPRKLHEPLEKISCQREGDASGGEIVSVLLTYLGGGGNRSLLANASSSQRRLFCFIGHLDGSLTRCELDTTSAKVLERVELNCGDGPCHAIGGDGESVCYVQAGRSAWRCDVRDGVPKTVPWRFPTHQTAFVPFTLPRQQGSSAASRASAGEDALLHVKEEAVLDENGSELATVTLTAASSSAHTEHVIGVKDKELSLFSAQQTGDGASSLEYSFGSHSLPLAGRRLVRHPTRSSHYILASTEHRGYGMEAVSKAHEYAGGIGPTAAERSLGKENVYNSTLQVYNEAANYVSPAYYLPEGDAITSIAVGSFSAAFGKEPVLIVGTATDFTHGAGCGSSPSWAQGWLRAFRFTASADGGHSALEMQRVHNTLIRTDAEPKQGGAAATHDYASALHICEDVGLLFVGLGEVQGLRVYTWGQHQLLRKRQLPNVPSRIIAIETVFAAPPAGQSASVSNHYFLSDLYQCPPGNSEVARRAREKQLLIVCATVSHSVFVASFQSAGASGGSTPSFMMVVGRDSVPRSLTSLAVIDDGRTIAVSDKFCNVVFLRMPEDHRLGFATPIDRMRDAEIDAAQQYISEGQTLKEVASHCTGQLVTALRVQPYDPSNGTDASLATRILYYSTSLGAVGAYVPFVSEEDATLAAYVQPKLAMHMRLPIAGPSGCLPAPLQGGLTAAPSASRPHHVIEGDLFNLYRQASTSVFNTTAKATIEEDIEDACSLESRRRELLGLPACEVPLVADLVAKQRALVTLPP